MSATSDALRMLIKSVRRDSESVRRIPVLLDTSQIACPVCSNVLRAIDE
jgi:hypothetical protein